MAVETRSPLTEKIKKPPNRIKVLGGQSNQLTLINTIMTEKRHKFNTFLAGTYSINCNKLSIYLGIEK
jgi:hypothetical protein